MKKTAVAAAALAGTAALSGAAIVSGPATASSQVTTVRLVLHQTHGHELSKYTSAGTDVDRSSGKIVGYDSIVARFHPSTGRVGIDIAFALRGGIITAHVTTVGQAPKFRGTILGGTRKYARASGTIRGHSPLDNSRRTFMTLRLR
jgi:hypothetical protein